MGALDSESLKHSLSSLKQLETLSIQMNGRFPGLWEAMNGLNIKSLNLCLRPRLSPSLSDLSPLRVSDEILKLEPAQLLCQSLLSLRQLESLSISVDEYHPGSLWEALKGQNIKSLSLSLSYQCFSWRGLCAKSLHQSLLSLSQLEKLSIDVNTNIPGLWEALIDLNIKSLSLSLSCVRKGLHEESLSQSLSSLKRLEMLTLHVYTYIDIHLPQSLKFFYYYCDALIPSKLRDLVEKLAACTHTIEFKLNFVCAAGVYPTEHVPLQEYSLIQQELRARKNIAVKRFRMYERICKSNTYEGFYNAESSTYERDAGGVTDDDHDDHSVNDDAYESFSKWMTDRNVNRISIRLQICPDSI
ncbi:hypothetical protein DPMN_177507 [Dreissena polymorpha]|uniref:Uncharacterized protein n=1 Tax=Dreissena polymorpha TaxID=45954 RepID=A0A9D4E8W3_DREPO|nr:hypothetical protein DPMN_177507 [Dreissena polymorpha]